MTGTLYERLGGNEGIRSIVDDAVDLHFRNPVVGTRFQKHDAVELKRLAHEFFCNGAGGTERYSGRDLGEAHRGLNISEQEFLATVDDIVQAMTNHGVQSAEQNEVIGILYALKGQVIRL